MARGGERTLTIKFVGDSKSTSRAIKDIVSQLDDTESAGKRVATAMRMLSDDAARDLAEAKSAADRLATALGDDTVREIQAAGRSVDGYIEDLRRMGLTYDDIRTDVDELADAIRRVESAAPSIRSLDAPLKDADVGIRNVRDSADQSQSVLANMVGNSVQDIGALGGVAGTAGMALGQFAEYATEGNISLSGLAKVAGPMLGVAAAGFAISKVIGTIRSNAQEAKEETELWLSVQEQVAAGRVREAMAALNEEYDGTLDALEELGYTSNDFLKFMRGQKDLVGPLSERYEALGSMMANAVDPAHALTEAQLDEYNALSKLIPNLRDAYNNRQNSITALDEEARRVDVLTRAYLGQQPVNRDLVNQYGRLIDRVEDVGEVMQETVEEGIDPLQQAIERTGEAYDRLKGKFDDRAAWDNANDAAKDLMETVAGGEATWDEIRRKTDDYTLALADVVLAMDDIPEELRTELITQLDAGQVDLVRGQLDALAKTRTAEFQIMVQAVASAELKQMEIRLNRDINGNGVIGRASGGPVWPGGVFAVGDNPDGSWNRTTELFVPNTAGNILSAADSRGALGGTTIIYQTFHVPPVVDRGAVGREVHEALLAFERESGPLAITTRR